MVWFAYILPVPNGLLLPDEIVQRDTAEALTTAEQSGDDLALDLARTTRGVVLVYRGGREREAGLQLLATARERMLRERFSMAPLPVADVCTARHKSQLGDFDGAIECSRTAAEYVFRSGALSWAALTVAALVESLLGRGSDADLREARGAIDRLTTLPTDPGYVLHEIWLLRLEALLAQADGDQTGYRHHRDRYRARATSLGFEGHMKWAESMP